MKKKHKRMIYIAALLLALAASSALVLNAFSDSLQFFYAPTELLQKNPPVGEKLRLGGMVEKGSLRREGALSRFRITDFKASVEAEYKGILPDLFREGSGAVLTGSMRQGGVFVADHVFAKHDENYMPPEIARSLKDAKP